MSISLYAKKVRIGNGDGQFALIPTDPLSVQTLSGAKEDEVWRVRCVKPRNEKHFRKFFVMLHEVYENQREPKVFGTEDHLRRALLKGLGFFAIEPDIDGGEMMVVDSMAYEKMDYETFTKFYDAAVDFVIQRVIPGVDKKDFENRIYEILGGPTPAMLEER